MKLSAVFFAIAAVWGVSIADVCFGARITEIDDEEAVVNLSISRKEKRKMKRGSTVVLVTDYDDEVQGKVRKVRGRTAIVKITEGKEFLREHGVVEVAKAEASESSGKQGSVQLDLLVGRRWYKDKETEEGSQMLVDASADIYFNLPGIPLAIGGGGRFQDYKNYEGEEKANEETSYGFDLGLGLKTWLPLGKFAPYFKVDVPVFSHHIVKMEDDNAYVDLVGRMSGVELGLGCMVSMSKSLRLLVELRQGNKDIKSKGFVGTNDGEFEAEVDDKSKASFQAVYMGLGLAI